MYRPILNKRTFRFIGFLVSLTWIANAASQTDQPIKISADHASRSELEGLTKYWGSVELLQGDITITADELEIRQPNGGETYIKAIGSPATFTQPASATEPSIDAQALTIKFAESKRTVILEEQAKILRGDSLISGPIIEYFIDEKRVQAGQDSVLAPERVEVIIPAKTQEP